MKYGARVKVAVTAGGSLHVLQLGVALEPAAKVGLTGQPSRNRF